MLRVSSTLALAEGHLERDGGQGDDERGGQVIAQCYGGTKEVGRRWVGLLQI